MSELMNALSNPGSMSQAQWLVIAIAAFIVIASLYFVWKLFQLVKMSSKTAYQPKIGLARTGYQHPRKTPKATAGEGSKSEPESDSGLKSE
jgi:hypothetical protein